MTNSPDAAGWFVSIEFNRHREGRMDDMLSIDTRPESTVSEILDIQCQAFHRAFTFTYLRKCTSKATHILRVICESCTGTDYFICLSSARDILSGRSEVKCLCSYSDTVVISITPL